MTPPLHRRHLLALAFGLSLPALATDARPHSAGRLMLIGGTGATPPGEHILTHFIALCADDARIVVLTSGDAGAGEDAHTGRLRELGVRTLHALVLTDADAADQDAPLALLEQADGILVAGDDPQALMRVLWRTEALRALQRALARGACVAAVDAAAVVSSDVVPSGGEDTAFPQLDTGLALIRGLLVDARFDQPRRMPQLMSALTLLPGHLGVGLDEDAALVIEAGRGVEVVGAGGVTLAEGRTLLAPPVPGSLHRVAPGTTQAIALGEGLHIEVSGGDQGADLSVLGLDAAPAGKTPGRTPMVGAKVHHLPTGGYWLDTPGMAPPLAQLVGRLVETLTDRGG